MDLTTVVGLAAGLLTTISKMFIAFCLGVALWLAYGFIKGDVPMIIWNSISLLLALSILAMKLKFG